MNRNCCFFALVLSSVFLPAIRAAAGDCYGIDYYVKSPPAPPGFPGSRDLSFHRTNLSGGWVWRVVALPNGKIIVADRNGIARLNADGSPDAGFVASITDQNLGPLNNEYTAIALQPDGKILVAGYFDTVNGSPQPFITRLNPNGSSDESFLSPFTESDLTNVFCCGRWSWSLALQADGKVLVAGGFVRVGQIDRSGLARLNADGSLDLTFSPEPIFPSERGSIKALVIQPDQNVLIGASYGIYRLRDDGSLDASFGDGSGLQGNGVGGDASLLALQPDGKVLAGWSGLAGWAVERFSADGTPDTGFKARFGARQSCGSVAIALQTNGKILVGGEGVVRLNPDGELDAGFDLAAGLTEALESRYVFSLGIQTDGQVVIAGTFIGGGFSDVEFLVRVHGGEWPTILPRSVWRLATGEFQFQATGPPDRTWIIQATTNLAAPNWTAIATNTLGTESLTFSDPGAANISSRYYRAVLSQ